MSGPNPGSGPAEPGQLDVAEAAPPIEQLPPTALLALARVNLMPASYARRVAVRRAKFVALFALLGAALVAVLAFLMSWQQASAAQERLDQAVFDHTMLQAEAAKYADVPRVFQAVDDAEAQLAMAMANEVRWSFFLNDIALTIPSGVSLDSLQLTVVGPGQVATDTGDGRVGEKLGTLTVTGKALSYPHVANWLDSIGKMKTIADPYVNGLAVAEVEATELVSFTSTGDITTETLSRRYVQEAAR